jgi:hypothetical protein
MCSQDTYLYVLIDVYAKGYLWGLNHYDCAQVHITMSWSLTLDPAVSKEHVYLFYLF